MVAPVLTAFTDASPCPRVEVFFSSFVAGTTHVTVYRLASGVELPVRGAVRAPTGGTLTRIDFEAPFNVPVSYRAEQFDAAGLSLGFTETGVLGDQYSPWVEVARNLPTNPSFEAGSGTAEVRRNLIPSPDTSSVGGWAPTAGAGTLATEGGRLKLTSNGTNTGRLGALIDTSGEKPAGTYAASFKAEALSANLTGVRVYLYHTTTGNLYQQSLPVVAGNTKYEFTVTAAAAFNRVYMEFYGTVIASGDVGYISEPMLESGSVHRAFFRPGVTSPDSDLTASWVSTANASESILTGVGVTSVTSSYSGARGFQSSQWASSGSKSLRIRSIGGAASAAVATPISLTAGKTYTLIAKVRLTAPLTNTAEQFSRALRLLGPTGNPTSPQAPNEAGVHEIRWTITPDIAATTLQIWHGGSVGSPDIWWDDLLIVEGAYDGPYFDGSTVSPTPETVRYSWAAAVNASESTHETREYLGVGLISPDSWMHNPLDPQGSARVVFGDDTAWSITRPTPGVVSRPKGRRVGVVLSEPRQGIVGFRMTLRTSSTADADRVHAMFGDDGRPPVVCVRLGGDDQRMRVPQPLFLSTLTVDELDMNVRWGGSELAHRIDGDEVDPPIPGLFVPLLTRADLNAFFATRADLNAGGLTRADINRRYDLAGAAG